MDTKTLAGRVAATLGTSTQRFQDDPRPRRHNDLAETMRAQVARIAHVWSRRTGRVAPPMTSVVVIWENVADAVVEHDDALYVAGTELVGALRQLDAAVP